jgi:curved DNA-binding protein CbpA
MNLYETLEINDGASLEEIKKSYRKLARKYHPDKTGDNNYVKFLEISSAYEILSNDISRAEYIKLPDENKNKFQEFLNSLFGHKIDITSLSGFGISLTKDDMDYIKSDLDDVLKKLNLKEVFKFFKDGILPKKDFESFSLCSDSEVNSWTCEDAMYFDSLPIQYQQLSSSDGSLNISQNISLHQLFKNSKLNITIKRKTNVLSKNEYQNTKFSFNVSNQLIIFNSGGDISDDECNYGDLIIRLNLPKNLDWQENIILYQKKINLYEFIYGINLSFNDLEFGDINKVLSNKSDILWVPIREGNIIFLNTIDSNFKLAIKLIVDFNDSNEIRSLIKENFC